MPPAAEQRQNARPAAGECMLSRTRSTPSPPPPETGSTARHSSPAGTWALQGGQMKGKQAGRQAKADRGGASVPTPQSVGGGRALSHLHTALALHLLFPPALPVPAFVAAGLLVACCPARATPTTTPPQQPPHNHHQRTHPPARGSPRHAASRAPPTLPHTQQPPHTIHTVPPHPL